MSESPRAGFVPESASGTAHRELQAVLDRWLAGRKHVRVLDAGCGANTNVRLPMDAVVTGIDIAASQLARNKALQKRILGDIQTYDFGAAKFDLIVCYNVLEHVPDPERAVLNLLRACSANGVVLIAVPNPWSVKGIVTKCTPFAVHRLFYAWMGDRRAGTAEFDQFPTYLRLAMAPRNLVRIAEAAGARVLFFRLYEGPVQGHMRSRLWLADRFFRLVGSGSIALSRGRFNLNHSDVLRLLTTGPTVKETLGKSPPARTGEEGA